MPDPALAHLYEDDPPLGLRDTEAVCPSCRLVYNEASGFGWGVCPDCLGTALELGIVAA